MKKTIVLAGLYNSNKGDAVILESAEYLIKKINPDINVKVVHLFPERKIPKRFKIKNSCEMSNFRQLLKILGFKLNLNLRRGYYLYKYYNDISQNADGIIFAGGGIIKFTRENLFYPLYAIISLCTKRNIPVYLNAAGVEGYDKNNCCCLFVKEILNKKSVKFVSTRDDIEILGKYITDKSKICVVGDSALWAQEVYPGIERQNSGIIGIGVIRGKIYTDYGINYSEEDIINTYAGLIRELERRCEKWQLFCNGLKSDYELGLKVLEMLNITNTEKYFAKRPETGEELVEIISKYKALIAARLHANIIAASYNIPSVGLVWNDKLKLFGSLIGFPERFIDKENFQDSSMIINRLEKAIQECNRPNDNINELKQKTVDKLKEFLQSITGI